MFGEKIRVSRDGESSNLGDFKEIEWKKIGEGEFGFYRGILIRKGKDGYSVYSHKAEKPGLSTRIEPHASGLGFVMFYKSLEDVTYGIMAEGY